MPPSCHAKKSPLKKRGKQPQMTTDRTRMSQPTTWLSLFCFQCCSSKKRYHLIAFYTLVWWYHHFVLCNFPPRNSFHIEKVAIQYHISSKTIHTFYPFPFQQPHWAFLGRWPCIAERLHPTTSHKKWQENCNYGSYPQKGCPDAWISLHVTLHRGRSGREVGGSPALPWSWACIATRLRMRKNR